MLYNTTIANPLANPLAPTIAEAEQIIADLRDASSRLQTAIVSERSAYGRLRDVQEYYDHAEAEYIAEAVVQAASAKTGPLGGIPVSSDGYKYAMTNLKVKLRNEMLSDIYLDLDQQRLGYDAAQIDRQQAETEFNALRKIAELKAMILRAAAL